ncbi:MAG TPA: PepSY domain-containing protein [Bryobacteraceae bacterium]|nr:PepSY domain-containing protein [Bryobacteraceae bacterium]
MPLPAEPLPKSDLRRRTDTFTVWNRKLHYYLGLYFLCFMWLFAFSGLLLNHSSWAFAQFFPNRKITKFERAIQPLPAGAGDLEQARGILGQLGIEGEVLLKLPRTDPTRFEFNVTRPGHVYQLQADLPKSRAAVTATEYNTWGVLRTLHTFSGGAPGNHDNWLLTAIWAFSMDAVAAGIIFMVLSSFYMWWRLKEKRTGGIVALVLGTAVGGLFVFGLSWLFG